ncbi:DUF4358 domain-containing protein [Cohnella sp. LGH]|uniref:DUF4358 domain-containing protein n=1 Tax=Cohnella sp. LGH TaxID=1619153 RepID=UPI001ADC250D|nr:DUF4358 domain-containing protein [Cohnella sp. LGH]QTH41156.1 DUF4358 domain-containing protein [Cohnella sp. LGH]
MKKSAMSFLLITALLGSLLTACSGNADKNNSTPTATSSPTASESVSPSPESSPSASPEASPSEQPEASPSESAQPGKTPEPSPSPSESAKPDKKPQPSPSPSESAKPDKKPEPSEKPKSLSSGDIVDFMLEQVEQPASLDMNAEQMEEAYGIDPDILENFAVRAPFVNIKSNELALFKVKKAKDAAAVKKGIEKRAGDIQKSFESYLPDQYENSKNYRVVTQGNYVLFIISESADDLEKAFKGALAQK